jgi:hypothetical protein
LFLVLDEVRNRLPQLPCEEFERLHGWTDLPELERADVRASEVGLAQLGLAQTGLGPRLPDALAQMVE